MKRRVLIVVTARPSYARVRTVLEALRERDDVELQLVVAASALLDRFGNVTRLIEADGFPITARVHMILEGGGLVNAAKSTGIGLSELAGLIDNLRPDIVVSIADRYETMATAVATSYLHVPLLHLQGGEITGSIDEKVRHAVTRLADLHCAATDLAGVRLREMGEPDDRIHVTGCPSIDLAARIADEPFNPGNPVPHLFERYGGVGAGPFEFGRPGQEPVIFLQHGVTTHTSTARDEVEATLAALECIDRPILGFWPNVDPGSDLLGRGIRAAREHGRLRSMHLFKHVDALDFLRLLRGAAVIVGNSSVAIREGAYLGIPSVNIGDRQRGRERGANVIDVPAHRDAILHAIENRIEHGRFDGDPIYGDGAAGPRVADLLCGPLPDVEKRLELPCDAIASCS